MSKKKEIEKTRKTQIKRNLYIHLTKLKIKK